MEFPLVNVKVVLENVKIRLMKVKVLLMKVNFDHERAKLKCARA
ncbi:MAG TPA: hypothetical protein VGQ36_16315 [Thermoanaerobaculia bacterium]|nr:hypothetical protein [Thermoanaerobaculia bacterium]